MFYVLRALVNLHKVQKSLAVQQVGVAAFYQVVSFVCEDTLRHPPTRQYLSSCVEILGQVRTQTQALYTYQWDLFEFIIQLYMERTNTNTPCLLQGVSQEPVPSVEEWSPTFGHNNVLHFI